MANKNVGQELAPATPPALDPTTAFQALDLLARELTNGGVPDNVIASWLMPVYVRLQNSIPAGGVPPLTARLANLVGVARLAGTPAPSVR